MLLYQLDSPAQVVEVGVCRDGAECLLPQRGFLLHSQRPPRDTEVVPQLLGEKDFPQGAGSVVLVMLMGKFNNNLVYNFE